MSAYEVEATSVGGVPQDLHKYETTTCADVHVCIAAVQMLYLCPWLFYNYALVSVATGRVSRLPLSATPVPSVARSWVTPPAWPATEASVVSMFFCQSEFKRVITYDWWQQLYGFSSVECITYHNNWISYLTVCTKSQFSVCGTTLTCENNGLFDDVYCKCDCEGPFSGNTCASECARWRHQLW